MNTLLRDSSGVEQVSHTHHVAGSSPAPATSLPTPHRQFQGTWKGGARLRFAMADVRRFFFGVPRNRRGKQLHRLLAVNHEVRMF